MSRAYLTLFTLAFTLTGCEKPLACDTMAAASISLTIVDDAGAPVAGATGVWSAASGASGDCDAWGSGSLACAYEVAGDITVTISAPGFEDAVQTFTVEQGECHVIGETAEIALTPAAPACTEEARPSVLVTVEGAGGEALTGVAVSFDTPTGDGLRTCSDIGTGVWACGTELAGEIAVTAVADGHEAASETVTIEMTEDGCHVITEEITLSLQWLPD
jgi:hypothetical protein